MSVDAPLEVEEALVDEAMASESVFITGKDDKSKLVKL